MLRETKDVAPRDVLYIGRKEIHAVLERYIRRVPGLTWQMNHLPNRYPGAMDVMRYIVAGLTLSDDDQRPNGFEDRSGVWVLICEFLAWPTRATEWDGVNHSKLAFLNR